MIQALVMAILGLAVFQACQKESSGVSDGRSAVKVFLTDHPTPVFDSVFVEILGLAVKVEDDSTGQESWIALDIHPGVYNILQFRNGLDTLFASGNLPSARLKKIRLILGDQNRVTKDGQSFPLTLHDSHHELEVDISEINFQVDASGQIRFWIDFDAGQSIRVDNSGPGNNNGFELEPHIKIFSREKSGSIEGRVEPREADAIVSATDGIHTAFAIPDDDDGEFKILGLDPGVYTILFDGQHGYGDTTLTNIRVERGEDTKVPTVRLHQ